MNEKEFKLLVYLLKEVSVTLEVLAVSMRAVHQIDAETLARTRLGAEQQLDAMVKEFLE